MEVAEKELIRVLQLDTIMLSERNNPSYTVTLTGQIQCHLKAVEGILLALKGIESSLSESI